MYKASKGGNVSEVCKALEMSQTTYGKHYNASPMGRAKDEASKEEVMEMIKGLVEPGGKRTEQADALGKRPEHLTRYCRAQGILPKGSIDDAVEAEGRSNCEIPVDKARADKYKILEQFPAVRGEPFNIQDWVANGSWTWCPNCHRRRPNGKLTSNWRAKGRAAVEIKCKGGCDKNPHELSSMQEGAPADDSEDEVLYEGGAAEAGKPYIIPSTDRAIHREGGVESVYGKDGEHKLVGMYTNAAGDIMNGDWPQCILDLTHVEIFKLNVVTLRVKHDKRRGGKAPTFNYKKLGVVTAHWRRTSVERGLDTPALREAYRWLMKYNSTYRSYVGEHTLLLLEKDKPEDWFVIKTARLLQRMHGVEVAARPWLYPLPEYADSDLKTRLVVLKQITIKQKPSIKSSWTRKVTSRVRSYEADFELFSLLYDISLARQLSAVVAVADKQKMAPEAATANMQNFSAFWEREAQKLEDMCRQQKILEVQRRADEESELRRLDKELGQKQLRYVEEPATGMPNLFFTIAPAEWKFNWNRAMLQWTKEEGFSESEAQAVMTLHLNHVIGSILREVVLKKGAGLTDEWSTERRAAGIDEVYEYSFRWEFQARGTLHVHVVAWVRFMNRDLQPERFNGRSNQDSGKSTLVLYLEMLFRSSVDVQCGGGSHCHLRYVTGYISKASDALSFKMKEYRQVDTTHWRQTYRMMCKKAPLLPEMALEFAGMPMMEASYRGSCIYAPTPNIDKSNADASRNISRALYEAYLREQATIVGTLKKQSFIEWARENTVLKFSADGDELVYQKKKRGGHGVGMNKALCALGVKFAFEGLDIFVGQWCAMMIPHASESEFSPATGTDAPRSMGYFKSAMDHPHYNGEVEKMLAEFESDMHIRGLNDDRIKTFKSRMRAQQLLLYNTGANGMQIPVNIWEGVRDMHFGKRTWSKEQTEVIELVENGVAVDDANVDVHGRMLLVTGQPGAGKTEAVVGCAVAVAAKGEKVLIACPIGALVDTYRQRLPPNENITIETVHASHRITRRADEVYNPPGRLRVYDLIIYEEVSQLQDDVWTKVRTAITELNPHPFVMFVGDFQQLQPAFGDPTLKTTLHAMVAAGTLRHIVLQQHALARSNDPRLLDFLEVVRTRQPKKEELRTFFGDRRLAPDEDMRSDQHVSSAVEASIRAEQVTGKPFTFLTVTNSGARMLNHTRCLMEFGEREEVQNSERHMVNGDPELGGAVVAIPGMRVRLTRNIDKERGFVNGALAEVEYVLKPDVLVVKTARGVRFLVYPITYNKATFVPFCYGYAMTIRRAQGSTLALVGLWFNHKYPADRGYGYVGGSRVRFAEDLALVGKLRCTDWLPVGEEQEAERTQRGSSSESDHKDSSEASEDQAGWSDDESMLENQSAPSEDDESEKPVADDTDEEREANSEDQGADSDDEGFEGDHEEDYDRLADVAFELHEEVQRKAQFRQAAPRASPPAPIEYTSGAVAILRRWHEREGVAGPHRQQTLGEFAAEDSCYCFCYRFYYVCFLHVYL